MTIQSIYTPPTYQGDGISTAFPTVIPYQFASDLLLQTEVVATGLVTTLVLGTDYTVTPSTQLLADAGTVTLTIPLPIGSDLLITRSIPITQQTHWLPNDTNPAQSTENMGDKLTMILQGFSFQFGRTWFLPPFGIDGSSYFDARQNRGSNLGDPVQPQDAVNYRFLLTTIAQLNATGSILAPLDYEYVGDGATTAFALAGATVPFTTGYFVNLDGVTQRPTSDYTITLGASPQIIFTSAPPANVLISIRVLGYAQPILSGINGSAITSGVILPQFLGLGTPSISTFLRGDGNWSNTLVGSTGAVATSGGVVADFQNAGASAIRVASNGLSGVWFAQGGSGNTFDAAWQYDPSAAALGFYATGTSTALSRFSTNGNVSLANGALSISYATGQVSVPGTFFGFNITGNASGALITSGQVQPQFLASNFPTPGYVLGAAGLWVPNGGGSGGGNTTTTASFTIAAVSSSQTVAVTSTTGLTNGAYVFISDGTHTIQGQITGITALNLTVVTAVISAGAAGNTMATGATVGLASTPGNNSIQVSDLGTATTAASQLVFQGSAAMAASNNSSIQLYIQNLAGGSATIAGYVNRLLYSFIAPAISGGATAPSVIGFNTGLTSATQFAGGGTGQVLVQKTSTQLGFQLLGAVNINPNSLTAALLLATNSPTNGQVPTYNSGTGGFTWAASGSGSVPTGGTVAQFLRGDGIWSNTFQATGPLPSFQLLDIAGTGTTSLQPSSGSLFITSSAAAYQVNISNGGLLNIGNGYTPNDSPVVETLYSTNLARSSQGFRADRCGYWQHVSAQNAPASTFALDMGTSTYVRFTGFANNVTFTLADTSPGSNTSYAGTMTIEIVAPGTFTVSWPGTITWLAGSAPTLSTSGTTLIQLYRRQSQTQWLGVVLGIAGGTYTDAQARTAVLQTTYLTNSSSVNWNIVGGTSAQPFIPSGAITNSMLAGGIALSQLSTSGSASSSTYLRGDGVWSPISGGSSLPVTTKGDLLGYNTAAARIPVGSDGTVLFADSTQSLGVRWGTLPGGTFSPSTAYTWTGGQAFNSPNTHAATVLHSVPFASTYGSSVATVGTGGLGDGSLGTVAALFAHTENHASAAQSINVQTASFWQSMYNPGPGINAIESVLDLRGNCATAGFHIGFSHISAVRQSNNASHVSDGLWVSSCSPDIYYTGGTVDGNGIGHSFTAGVVRIGEVNYGNLWQDFGLFETVLAIASNGRSVQGLGFYPDALPGPVAANGSPVNKFDAQVAISISYAGVGGNGLAPRNHIGLLVDQNGTSPNGYGLRVWGAQGTFNGNSAATNAPAACMKMSGTAQTGIDFAGTANDTTIMTATNTGAPVITMTDATQSIKLGSVWIRGNGGHLQYSTNGTSWTNIV